MTVTRANPGGLDVLLDLDAALEPGGRQLRRQLEDQLRGAVRDGRLRPGALLPPSRSLAADLGVARNTVAEAYTQLVGEGWLVARQGSGTRVADRPVAANDPRPAALPPARPPRYDLRAGFPDVTAFPRAAWLAATRAALAGAGDGALGYGPPEGMPELRAALAGYAGRTRGVHATAERVVVTAGFTNGLRVLADALRAGGARRVGVERYGHAQHRAVLAAAGLELVPLEVDDEGAVPDGLDRLAAVLLTSAHQFPLGVALSARRRAAFTRWASRRGGLVIEDDYDGEFRYDRRNLGAVQALAPDHVVYAGTASKTLAPGLRLGWLVVPPGWVQPLAEQQRLGAARPSVIDQLALARFLDTGRYDRQVRRMRLHYRGRRERLVAGLARRVPGLQLTGMQAGLHALLPLPDDRDPGELIRRAGERELAIEALAGYADGPGAAPGLVIGFGTPAPRAYTTALARLFAVLASSRG